jgi:hypothetical protein
MSINAPYNAPERTTEAMSTTPVTPQRAQRTSALDRANATRSRRLTERHRIGVLSEKAAAVALVQLLVDCPDWLANNYVDRTLIWLPHVGADRAARIIANALPEVRGRRTVGDLTSRQRARLAAALMERAR